MRWQLFAASSIFALTNITIITNETPKVQSSHYGKTEMLFQQRLLLLYDNDICWFSAIKKYTSKN